MLKAEAVRTKIAPMVQQRIAQLTADAATLNEAVRDAEDRLNTARANLFAATDELEGLNAWIADRERT